MSAARLRRATHLSLSVAAGLGVPVTEAAGRGGG